jgi:hypothetical protein
MWTIPRLDKWPYAVHKLSQSKRLLLVQTLHELAKTSDHLVIPCRRLVHFGQNHAFGGLRSGLLGVFREFEFGDRTMKHGKTLGVIRFCGHQEHVAGAVDMTACGR